MKLIAFLALVALQGQERIPPDKLPKDMKERVQFVLKLNPPDPSYLARDAAAALPAIVELLEAAREDQERQLLLIAYAYLARLRSGLKSPDILYKVAGSPYVAQEAALAITTVADERAETWFLEQIKTPMGRRFAGFPGGLHGEKVKEALVKLFMENERSRMNVLEALVDRGCVEILPELKKMDTRRHEVKFAIERLEIFGAPDRDDKLMHFVMNPVRSGNIFYPDWGLDQILRLDLKHLAPKLREWYDKAKGKWAPSHDPNHFIYKMPWALHKLGATLTPEEEHLMWLGGRGP